MLSLPLLKKDFKENDKLWLVFAGILTVYTLIMVGMYDPYLEAHLDALVSSMPEFLLRALGMDMVEKSMTGFFSAYLFGFLFLVLPMIYEMILARRLVERLVSRGTAAYLLNTFVSRKKLIITQGYFLAVSLFALFFYGSGLGFLAVWLVFPEAMEPASFLLLYAGAFCLHFFMSGICFVASCFCDRDREYLAAGAGIPLLFYLFHILGGASDSFRFFRYFTPFSLFDVTSVLEGSIHLAWMFPVLALGGGGLYLLGIWIFRRKELRV